MSNTIKVKRLSEFFRSGAAMLDGYKDVLPGVEDPELSISYEEQEFGRISVLIEVSSPDGEEGAIINAIFDERALKVETTIQSIELNEHTVDSVDEMPLTYYLFKGLLA